MPSGELTGVVITVAFGVLAFAVSRYATRYFTQRRADREKAKQAAGQSRQVRRANARRQR
ncbi:MAG: hypothetical protein GXD23_03445 [Comamonadaceae bacterium]|jgi:uncharacterized protein (DUF2062 family)|nr:hypothetical protein [Comamonadaceae bacterium]